MAQEVSFLCKRTVVSTKPVEQGKFFSLSVLDRVMERKHLLVVLYYHSPPGANFGDLTRTLRISISSMLCAFPIVTGRLVKSATSTPQGHWMIKYNDAGVRMVEATAKGSVDEWLQNVTREKELMLVHWEPMFHKPYFWSTFYVQLTEFEEGGLAVGLSCTHLLADPTCATMFIKALADTTLSGKIVTPPLFHPLPSRRPGNRNLNHKPYTQLINHYKNIIDKPAAPACRNTKQTTIALEFKDEAVRSCIVMAKDPNAVSGNWYPSPFQALAGLLWVCISKVKEIKGGLVDMSLCLDMRKVLSLEKTFFGNCMVFNKVYGEGLSSEKELSEAANAIKEVEMKMDNEGVRDLIEWLEENDNYVNNYPPWMNGYDLICVNLEGVDAYSAVFGDGMEPIHASYYVEPASGEGQVLILPSHEGGGPFSRIVMVTLAQSEAIKLLGLQLIQQMNPTILMRPDDNANDSF